MTIPSWFLYGEDNEPELTSQISEQHKDNIYKLVIQYLQYIKKIAEFQNIVPAAIPIWNSNLFAGAIRKDSIELLFANSSEINDHILLFDLSSNNESLNDIIVNKEFHANILNYIVLPLDRNHENLILQDVKQYILKLRRELDGWKTSGSVSTDGNNIDFRNQKTHEITDSEEIDENFCFVIMSFSEDSMFINLYKDHLKPTVERLGYRCERVDEQHYNGDIVQQIKYNISKAKFIIADLTENRPNCYYELGIAHERNKKVIHIAHKLSNPHFDVNHFNFIKYDERNLSKQLEERIMGLFGKIK